jgi:hypothetical protein
MRACHVLMGEKCMNFQLRVLLVIVCAILGGWLFREGYSTAGATFFVIAIFLAFFGRLINMFIDGLKTKPPKNPGQAKTLKSPTELPDEAAS